MKNPRTRTQYRLTWQRGETAPPVDGIPQFCIKSKSFVSRKGAERYIRILTSAEPWREWAPNKGPEDYACCKGDAYSECGCGGKTNAQVTREARAGLPPIKWIRLEERKITTTPFVEVQMLHMTEEAVSA